MSNGTILIAGASRGLGAGLARHYAAQGWRVTATIRSPEKAPGLPSPPPENLTLAPFDITSQESLHSLAARIPDASLDILFAVAGIFVSPAEPVRDWDWQTIANQLATNAFGPFRLAHAFTPKLKPGALVALMTSSLGSIGLATAAFPPAYSASKAALNMFGKIYAAQHPQTPVLLVDPGWVKTDMGGANAPVELEESVTGMARVIEGYRGKPGVAYVNYQGKILPF